MGSVTLQFAIKSELSARVSGMSFPLVSAAACCSQTCGSSVLVLRQTLVSCRFSVSSLLGCLQYTQLSFIQSVHTLSSSVYATNYRMLVRLSTTSVQNYCYK